MPAVQAAIAVAECGLTTRAGTGLVRSTETAHASHCATRADAASVMSTVWPHHGHSIWTSIVGIIAITSWTPAA
jgi:hypothetical protein